MWCEVHQKPYDDYCVECKDNHDDFEHDMQKDDEIGKDAQQDR